MASGLFVHELPIQVHRIMQNAHDQNLTLIHTEKDRMPPLTALHTNTQTEESFTDLQTFANACHVRPAEQPLERER